MQKSCRSKKASIQKLRQIKAVVFEKDKLEIRDTSGLKELLPPLTYENSISNVEAISSDT